MLSLSSSSASTAAAAVAAIKRQRRGRAESGVGMGPTFVHLRDLSTGPRARTHVRTVRTYARTHARTYVTRRARGIRPRRVPRRCAYVHMYSRILSSCAPSRARAALASSRFCTCCSDTYPARIRQGDFPTERALPPSSPLVFLAFFPPHSSLLFFLSLSHDDVAQRVAKARRESCSQETRVSA